MNIIAPRDQFGPVGVGENLVVKYKGWWCLPRTGIVVLRDCFKPVKIGENLVGELLRIEIESD